MTFKNSRLVDWPLACVSIADTCVAVELPWSVLVDPATWTRGCDGRTTRRQLKVRGHGAEGSGAEGQGRNFQGPVTPEAKRVG